MLGWLARCFGPQFVLPTIDAKEQVDSGDYATQSETSGTLMPSEERSHARLLRAISSGFSAGLEGGAIARLEGRRHRAASGGNALRVAVLGANDGLLSNFSLVMVMVRPGLPIEEADNIAEEVRRKVHKGTDSSYCVIRVNAAVAEDTPSPRYGDRPILSTSRFQRDHPTGDEQW